MSQPNADEINLLDEDFYKDNDPSNNDYEVVQDPNMAATLGFASFGAQDKDSRPAKKRRFNPQSDIANRAKPATTDEITYSDPDYRNGNGNGNGGGDNANNDDNDFELDLEPEAPPSPPAEGPSTPTPAVAIEAVDAEALKATSASIPTLLPASSRGGRGGGRGGSGRNGERGGGGGGGGGGINPEWYIDYYDPSSNENPWEGMEKFKGLKSVGTWLPSRWAPGNDAAGAGAVGQDVGAGPGGDGAVASTVTAA